MRQRLVIATLAAACLLTHGEAAVHAQTTSARGESLSVSVRADELRESGAHKRAVQLYARALELDSRNERAYLGLSASLDALSRHERALRLLQRAQARMGWTAKLGFQRGLHLVRLERWDDAVRELDRALAASPRSHETAYYLALANLERSRWAAAVTAFDTYLAHRPAGLAKRDPQIQTRRAFALLHAGDHVAARRALEPIVAAAPQDVAATMLLFTALARGGACKPALALLDELGLAIARAPTLRYNAAVCQFRSGRARSALAILRTLEQRGIAPIKAPLLKARIYTSLGDRRRAETAYRKAIAAGLPAEAELAANLSQAGKHQEVVALLRPLIDGGSREPEVLELAAGAFLATGDLDGAARASQQLVEVRPNAAAWLVRGDVQLRRKLWAEAAQAYQRASAEAPGDRRARTGIRQALEQRANVAFAASDHDGARQLLARALAADPAADDVAHNLALLELAGGDAEKAVQLLANRVEKPGVRNRTRMVLARAYLATGEDEGASRLLESIAADPKASTALRGQALSSLAFVISRSSPTRALALVERARKLGDIPESARASLDGAAANARLALAEQAYRRGSYRNLRDALGKLPMTELDAPTRVEARLLGLVARAHKSGLTAALRDLRRISNADLETVRNRRLSARNLRHAITAELGARFLRRPAEYRRLRTSLAALDARGRRGSKAAKEILTATYDVLLHQALRRGDLSFARTLADDAPTYAHAPTFDHNSVIARVRTRARDRPLNTRQLAVLRAIAAQIPEAALGLAVDAENRADHPEVVRRLLALPASKRSSAVNEWLRWKELVHGAP